MTTPEVTKKAKGLVCIVLLLIRIRRIITVAGASENTVLYPFHGAGLCSKANWGPRVVCNRDVCYH
jgi:hypothetical protein